MGVLTDLVPELGAPKHLDRDCALQRVRALLSSSAPPAPSAPPSAPAAVVSGAVSAAPPPSSSSASAAAARAATRDEHTPAAITTPVERPRLTACTFSDRRELAAFEAAVEGPALLGCRPPPGEEAGGRGGSPGWERRLGGLSAARALVEARGAASEAFEARLLGRCLAVLEDGEVRVRQAAGGCLAALAAARGVAVLDAALAPLLASIRRNFDREGEEGEGEGGEEGGAGEEEGRPGGEGGNGVGTFLGADVGGGDAPPPLAGTTAREGYGGEAEAEAASAAADPATATAAAAARPAPPPPAGDLLSSLLASAYKPLVPGSGEMRHGTEGWKALETSVRALQQVVDALPPRDVAPRLGAPVRAVLYGSLRHPNRFVRETGHFMLASAAAALAGPELEAAAPELAPRIADGLADNWSQVRYAAGVGARAFMAALGALGGGGAALAACAGGDGGRGGGGALGGGGGWEGGEGGQAGGDENGEPGDGEANGEGEDRANGASAAAAAAPPPTTTMTATTTTTATTPKQQRPINSEVLSRVLPVLLPPMCLNRYYVAAGVRLYAQATWRLLFVGASAGGEEGEDEWRGNGGGGASGGGGNGGGNGGGSAGRAAVAAHCPAVAAYYVSQSKANNHAVREAACACIAELMEKVDRAAVAPHVPALLAALRACFRDASWPVRDAACTALGRCVEAYPEETRGSVLAELYELWAAHLWDNIPTVRENSAAALGGALRTYGTGGEVGAAAAAAASLRAAAAAAANANANAGGGNGPAAHAGTAGASNGGGPGGAAARCASLLRDLLPRALDQPEESARYAGLENTTTFGVAARKARDNDASVHTGQDLFSCGSLTARFSTQRLVRSDGCMDHGFSRGRQPWEASDGAVHLLREYCVWWAGAGAGAGPAAEGGEGGGGGGNGGGGNGDGGGAPPPPPPPAADPVEFLPVLLALARLNTFQHAANLRETVWKCLPDVARGVGARRFKAPLGGGGGSGGGGGGGADAGDGSGAGDEGGYLALFAQAAVDDLRCGHQLAAAAAGRALAALRDAYGARVLSGRLKTEAARRALQGDPNVPRPIAGAAPRGAAAAAGGGGGGAAASTARGAGSLLFRDNDALLKKT